MGSTGLPRELELEFQQRPVYHSYSFGVIRLFIRAVLKAATSIGAASAMLGLIREFLPGLASAPNKETGELWMLRIGLYELTRPKEVCEDRVWIIDHTVQIGTTKCLLIVSCRRSWWQENRGPLRHQDLEFVALEPVRQSNGKIVREQLEKKAAEIGVPVGIVSDQGTDIQAGIEAFRQAHPTTLNTSDISHKVANLLRHELEADKSWSEFLTQIGIAKQRLQQTALSFLTPPTPRNKARYMNIEELINWGVNTIAYLRNPRQVGDPPVDKQQLKKKLGWLPQFQAALSRWNTLMRVVATTLEYIRDEGYHRRAAHVLQLKFRSITTNRQSRRLATAIVSFVKEQSAEVPTGQHMIGTSEVIESLIGKGKRLEAQQSKSGFTRLVLGMAAAVVKPTNDYLRQALKTVKTSDLTKWRHETLGVSVQSQRMQAIGIHATEQKRDKKVA